MEESVCECPDCGNEDICIPDSVCLECGTGLMLPIDDIFED